jgi:hypothetical protein
MCSVASVERLASTETNHTRVYSRTTSFALLSSRRATNLEMAQVIVASPLKKLELADQHGLEPLAVRHLCLRDDDCLDLGPVDAERPRNDYVAVRVVLSSVVLLDPREEQ